MDHRYEAMRRPESIHSDAPLTICIVEDDQATGEIMQLIIAEETFSLLLVP